MDKLIMAVATGCGAGYLPVAPGTWGSLLALPIHYLLITYVDNWATHGLILLAIIIVGTLAAGSAEKILDRKDPGAVVIDEVAGMLITLMWSPVNIWIWLTGFVIFRIFDIAKPFPVNIFDQRLNGGIGIMLDDVASGIYSLAVLQIICMLL